jgi:glycosyltransferase involved in cell wall biosynthesis
MTPPRTSPRVTVDGKFFRCEGRKFFVKGVTYGPFAPDSYTGTFASSNRTAADFDLALELGANVLRVYYVPPLWFLELAAEHGLKVLIDIPWAKHLCFLDSKEAQADARRTVRDAVLSAKGHPAVFAWSVVNEIAAEIVRWSGAWRIERFIDSLVAEAKAVDPGCLCTFTSYPPTEFLQPRNIDFVCFNVYLHQRPSFEGYMARLQTLADARPLVLGEFGMDSIREGESHKCEFLAWQIESAFRAGLAGTVVFSFTDDWWRGGLQIEDWAFGLTTRQRQPKDSFRTVREQYYLAPRFRLPRTPKVSVVVASYNGARTLETCLASLTRLNYPDYEVIVVDDGSTDSTPEIASRFPTVRCLRQSNLGLSAARNAGIDSATGEIVAFTDDDCRADEDWLFYIVQDLLKGGYAGIGGHNFLPPDDSPAAAAVMASPGGPAHVMLTDCEAEHVPGCNMAFFKWALKEVGGFDPVFRKAGDDVDLCWRLQDREYKIGFSPAGFVWHYRRSTVKAYLRQQAGYGEAEALLARKHPERFNSFGGGIWRGRIYSASHAGLLLRRAVIYHGVFGSGFFQRLYAPAPFQPLMLCSSLVYHAWVNLPLLLASAYVDLLRPVAALSLLLSFGVGIVAGAQAKLPQARRRWWSRPLVAFLFLLQPIVRGLARVRSRLRLLAGPKPVDLEQPQAAEEVLETNLLGFWSKGDVDRYAFLRRLEAKLAGDGWTCRADTGWGDHDYELAVSGCARLRLTTVTEELELGRRTFRCRLESIWSAPARGLFWVACAIVVTLIALLAQAEPWLWMSAMVLPLLHGWFETDRRLLHTAAHALIEETARECGLVKLRTARPEVGTSTVARPSQA